MGCVACRLLNPRPPDASVRSVWHVRGIIIDAKEIEISDKCITAIIREQPIAGDLRFLITAMKIGSDLERPY